MRLHLHIKWHAAVLQTLGCVSECNIRTDMGGNITNKSCYRKHQRSTCCASCDCEAMQAVILHTRGPDFHWQSITIEAATNKLLIESFCCKNFTPVAACKVKHNCMVLCPFLFRAHIPIWNWFASRIWREKNTLSILVQKIPNCGNKAGLLIPKTIWRPAPALVGPSELIIQAWVMLEEFAHRTKASTHTMLLESPNTRWAAISTMNTPESCSKCSCILLYSMACAAKVSRGCAADEVSVHASCTEWHGNRC